MSDDLIPILSRPIGDAVNSVDARELHRALGVGRDFSTWIRNRIGELGLVETTDYETFGVSPVPGTLETKANLNRVDYVLTLDAAKHVALAERSERGRRVRNYFIAAEKKLREIAAPNLDSVDGLLALSSQLTTKLIATTKRAEAAEAKVVELEPKAGAYDRFLDAEGLCGLQNAGRALNVGPNLFVAALRSAGIVTRQGRANVAYATYVDRGYFEHRPVTFWNHKIGADEQTLQAFFTARGLAWAEKLIASGKLVVRGAA